MVCGVQERPVGRSMIKDDKNDSFEGTVTIMAEKPKKFAYVEPDDYIPKEIYDKYFGDEENVDDEENNTEDMTEEPEEENEGGE